MSDEMRLFGMPVVMSRYVPLTAPHATAYVYNDDGHRTIVMHFAQPLVLTDEQAARWWRETPAQHARRVVLEVLAEHAKGTGPVADAARAELEYRLRIMRERRIEGVQALSEGVKSFAANLGRAMEPLQAITDMFDRRTAEETAQRIIDDEAP